MPSAYDQLLDATIQRLEDLKLRGAKHVAVSNETCANYRSRHKTETQKLKFRTEG